MVKKIISFGYRHEWPPTEQDGLVLDIRKQFRNPYHDKKLRGGRGTDPAVQADIRKTPDFQAKVEALNDQIYDTTAEVVYIGCTGGHHRSVYLAILLGDVFNVPVEHRDYDKP